MGKKPGRNVSRARRVFITANGNAPWTCYGCTKNVTQIGRDTWDGNIHHLDDNVTNDTSSNLVMMHAICHQRLHGPPTEAIRQQISAKLRGRPSPTKGMKFPPEVNAKKSMPGELNPFYGRKHTDETRAKMQGKRIRLLCEDCGQNFAKNWIERHRKESRCIASRHV